MWKYHIVYVCERVTCSRFIKVDREWKTIIDPVQLIYVFTYFLLYVNIYFLSLPRGPLTSYGDDVDVLVEKEGNHEGEGDGPEKRDGDGDTTRSHLTHLTPWRPHYSVVPVT